MFHPQIGINQVSFEQLQPRAEGINASELNEVFSGLILLHYICTPVSELCTHEKQTAYKYTLQATDIYYIIKYINRH